MKNWIKTMLCAVSAATLVACGGGDYVDPGAGTGGGGGGTATPEAIAAMGTQGFVVANFGIGGAVDGMLFPVTGPMGPASLETPAAVEPEDITSYRCKAGGGSASQLQTNENEYEIVFTNCVHPDSDVKYNGKIIVVPVNAMGEEDTEYTVNFDSTGLQISLDIDGKSYSYIYKNRSLAIDAMVLSNINRHDGDVNKVTTLMNVAITIGTGSVTLEDYKLEFDSSVTPETIKLSGKYIVNLKTSDFGVTLPAGVPDMAFPLTFVTSTDPVLTVGDGDEFTGGTLKLEDATLGYKVETNFTTKKLTITVAGVASTYDF